MSRSSLLGGLVTLVAGVILLGGCASVAPSKIPGEVAMQTADLRNAAPATVAQAPNEAPLLPAHHSADYIQLPSVEVKGAEVESGGWEFKAAPYAWLLGMDGKVVERGNSQSLSVPLDTILDNLSLLLQGGMEARRDGWFGAFDFLYAGMASDGGPADVDVSFSILELRTGFELYRKTYGSTAPAPSAKRPRASVIDMYLGARYWYMDVTAKINVRNGPRPKIDDDGDRWDPMIGLGWHYDIADDWFVGVRADVGGFGIGTAARAAYQFQCEVGHRFSECASFAVGYRYLRADTISGSGIGRSGVRLNLSGLLTGLVFEF